YRERIVGKLDMDYSTKRITHQLIEEIKNALQSVHYGSIEIFVTDSSVTQITTRTIKKTSINLNSSNGKKSASVVQKNSNGHKKVYPANIVNIHTSVDK